MYCTVSLSTGAVRNRVISGVETADCRLSDAEMLQAAKILSPLIQEAASYYQAFPPIFEDGPLPFNMPMEMRFSSGAGAWSTFLTLRPDGSFEGKYGDTDMADGGSSYRTIEYVCNFHGRFGDIRKVTDASWSMALEDLVIDTERPIGEEWIKGNTLYISSAPYGLSKRDDEDGSIPLQPGAPFMLYTPEASGKPGGELYGIENEPWPNRFWDWWPGHYNISESGGTLGCYGLRNMETGYGFFS